MLLLNKYLNLYTCPKQSFQIMKYLKKYTNENDIICDCTSGIGGNCVNFCKYYNFVFAIDIEPECIPYLDYNLKHFDNKLIINGDSLDIIKIIKSDIFFFDPPWGGKDYKYLNKINLKLNGILITTIIDNLYKHCKIIALKAPNNFNFTLSKYWKIKEYNIYKIKNVVNFKLYIYYK